MPADAALPPSRLPKYCALDSVGRRLVTDAVDCGGRSARAVHRALRVARTIADLTGEECAPCARWLRRCSTGRMKRGGLRRGKGEARDVRAAPDYLITSIFRVADEPPASSR